MHNVYVRGRTRTHDHRVCSQAPNPIAPHRNIIRKINVGRVSLQFFTILSLSTTFHFIIFRYSITNAYFVKYIEFHSLSSFVIAMIYTYCIVLLGDLSYFNIMQIKMIIIPTGSNYWLSDSVAH